jgi:hypothetical protein
MSTLNRVSIPQPVCGFDAKIDNFNPYWGELLMSSPDPAGGRTLLDPATASTGPGTRLVTLSLRGVSAYLHSVLTKSANQYALLSAARFQSSENRGTDALVRIRWRKRFWMSADSKAPPRTLLRSTLAFLLAFLLYLCCGAPSDYRSTR